MIQQILYNCEEDRTVLIRKPQVISGEGVHLLHPPPRSAPGSGCKKYLKIKGTRNYYFKTLGYCSITKVNSSLISRRFAPKGKPYQIGLLFRHKNGWGGLISVCDGAKLRLGSDL